VMNPIERADGFVLQQNYPNPFNPTTAIEFSTPLSARISLKVFDLLGKLVATLVDDSLQAGVHKISWNAKKSDGTSLASGTYIYRLAVDGHVVSQKMLLLK